MQGFYKIGSADPDWRPAQQFTTANLPPTDRYWLLDDGSLTRHLIGLSRGPFRVQQLYQDWQVPRPSERILLNIPPRQLALVREVALVVAGNAVVFARSVFPHTSLTGSLTHLRKLQNKPLGAILFNHPGMHRSPFELARLRGNSGYLPPALQQGDDAWARRSRFTIKNKALLVSEVFLDKFSPWSRALPVHRSQRGTVSSAMLHPKP
ncbi:MAG: chorismate--pyruvate lyase [Halioglobus sp.]